MRLRASFLALYSFLDDREPHRQLPRMSSLPRLSAVFHEVLMLPSYYGSQKI